MRLSCKKEINGSNHFRAWLTKIENIFALIEAVMWRINYRIFKCKAAEVNKRAQYTGKTYQDIQAL